MKTKLIILTLILLSAVFLNATYDIIVHAKKSTIVGTASIIARHVGNAWEQSQTMDAGVNSEDFTFYNGSIPFFGSPYGLCTAKMTASCGVDEDTVPYNSSGTHIYLELDPINNPEPDDPPAGN